jgi:hypothetical protein
MDQADSEIQRIVNEIQNDIGRLYLNVGLGGLSANNEVQCYLKMPQKEIGQLSPHECGEAAVLLNQEAVFIQLQINKLKATTNWCRKKIVQSICKDIHTYGGKYTPYDYKHAIAVAEDSVTQELNSIKIDLELTLDALIDLPGILRNLAYTFGQMQQLKKGLK